MHNDSADSTHARSDGVVTRANMAAALGDPARKQAFVTPLFELIAPRYDRFTRVFSYGMDARWKEALAQWLAQDFAGRANGAAPERVLDVACGTGDLALLAARALPHAHIVGVDVAEGMLRLARERAGARSRVAFALGDLQRLPQGDGSVDAVMAGYALRNAPDPRAALGELARVLRRGGRLYVLDFFRPRAPLWRGAYLAYLRAAGALVGWWWHRSPAAYEYIAASIARFVPHDEFVRWLSAADFTVERLSLRLGGGVALLTARKR